MNWNQILDLQKDGMEIGSHTMNHIDLKGLSNKEIDYEIGQIKRVPEKPRHQCLNLCLSV